eukprot:TRINITY_DN38716_c0_g1_i1.p1 TRINITY_DN38716_c0_g1~~TRINITY_DN38716_c0_g1_i1.p1  ORF type:complete len:557 (-),score=34.59 TRINITY_DN38716_c0_g1_i1:31-1626(-)
MLGFRLYDARQSLRLPSHKAWPSLQFGTEFTDRRVELAFVEYSAPSIARSTVIGHAVALGISSLIFVWNMLGWEDASRGYDDAIWARYVSVMSVMLGVQVLICCALMCTANIIKCVGHVPWEALSIVTTAVFGLLLPWQTPCHASFLFGDRPHQLHGCEDFSQFDAICVVASKLIVDAYASYVPIRWRYSFVVPLCFTVSSSASLLIGDRVSSSSKVLVMPVLHLSCLFGKRWHELLLRERWLASERVLEISGESSGVHDASVGYPEPTLQERKVEEIQQPSVSDATTITVPGTLLSILTVDQSNEGVNSAEDDLYDGKYDSEISFAYTESVVETLEVPRMETVDRLVGEQETLELVTGTQASDLHCIQIEHLAQSKETSDAAVNTTLVWRQDAFSCAACAKPPKLPGTLLPVPNSGQAVHRAGNTKRKQQQQHYWGTEFNGKWMISEEDLKYSRTWLHRMLVDGCLVVFADFTNACITWDALSNKCFIDGCEIWLDVDGTLLRKGSSGRVVRYSRNCDGASSCSSVPQEY